MKAHTWAPMNNVAAAPHSALRQIPYDLLTDADLDEAPHVLLEHQVDPPLHSHTACPPSRLPSYPPLPRLLPPSAPQLPRLLPRSLPPPDAHTRSPTARCARTHTRTHDAHGSPGSRAGSCGSGAVCGRPLRVLECADVRGSACVPREWRKRDRPVREHDVRTLLPRVRARERARLRERACLWMRAACDCMRARLLPTEQRGLGSPHLGNGSGDSRRQGTRSSLQRAAGRVLKLHGYSGYHT